MGFGWSKCLLFVVVVLSFFLTVEPLCLHHEKLALLRFKQNFLIDCDFSGDPMSAYPKVRSWLSEGVNRSGDCCDWDGVECNYDTGHVTGLDLGNSCLYGTFPPNSSLFTLSHLEKFNLGHNHFNYSQMPHELGYLDKLTSLNLSRSWFSGHIPPEISRLSSLSILDLNGNFNPLRGNSLLALRDSNLETLIGNLTHLTELLLGKVDLSSNVPKMLTNLTSLRVISLPSCNLFGEFPSGIFQLPTLELVNLEGNMDLTGMLPEFPQNSHLKELNLPLTKFSGGLPPSIGYLGSLETLILWGCQFSGTIPSTLGNLTQLTDLNLSYNAFTGYIPFSIKNLTLLNVLGLSKLQLSYSDLTTWLVKLNKLTDLILPEMELVGEIPSSIANLTQLEFLDLKGNKLTGSIPFWFSNLTKLTYLDLGFNQLKGPIPVEFYQLINLAKLSLSQNTGLFGQLDRLLQLKELIDLELSGVNLMSPPNKSTNYSSSIKFSVLDLSSCNVTEFPQFLRGQDELQYLSLSGNNLNHKIPQWFMNTAKESLQYLDLSGNSLTGFKQPRADLPWSYLQYLDLSGNKLEGSLPIPPRSMQTYKVSGNQFSGLISEQICKASSLKVLDLSNNRMHGPLPPCLGNQLSHSLLSLNLRGNTFNGTIPQIHRKSCKLKMINLSENLLEGQLPRSLTNCKMLEVLDVGRNIINDTFPSWLGSLLNLKVLVLRHNNFHGMVPNPEVGLVFPSLRIIDLSDNFCMGDFPSEFFQYWDVMKLSDDGQNQSAISGGKIALLEALISGLLFFQEERYNYAITIMNKGHEMLYPKILNVFRVIDFSSNRFTGMIPDSIGNLRGLQALNLSNNNLHGDIPSSLSNITGLESLDLSQNMLSGEIPQELVQLTSLAVFNVSHNNLTGQIPQGLQFNTFDHSSYDGNSGLCGGPLPKKCGRVDSPPKQLPTSATTDNNEQNSELIDWTITLLGGASGFVVGYIVGKLFITDKYHEWFMETFGRHKRKPRRRVRRAPVRRN